MASYRIWAWIDRTSEDFVAVVAAIPEGGVDSDVISLSQFAADEKAARVRLELLVREARETIVRRGGDVVGVTMSKVPPQLRTMPRQGGGLLLVERNDLDHGDPASRGLEPFANGFYHRKTRSDRILKRADGSGFGETLFRAARVNRRRD